MIQLEHIPLFKVFAAKEAKKAVARVLESGHIGQGPENDKFEKALKQHALFGCHFLNTVNSATSGLQLALHMLQDKPGDTVLTTPLTCTATNTAIVAERYKLRWLDLQPYTFNISLEDLEKKLLSTWGVDHVKAVMLVHWAGSPVDMDRVSAILHRFAERTGRQVPVIADCAHAIGAKWRGQPIHSFSSYSVYSFQAIKTLTSGDGGALICANEAEHKRAKLLRWYGLDRTTSADFRCAQNITEAGFKYHLNDIAAAIGLANLEIAQTLVDMHQENGKWYDARPKVDGLEKQVRPEQAESAYWVYTVRVQRRSDFMKMMQAKGIHTSLVHDRNDKHDCFREFRENLPNLEDIAQEFVSIPCGWWVGHADRERIWEAIEKGW